MMQLDIKNYLALEYIIQFMIGLIEKSGKSIAKYIINDNFERIRIGSYNSLTIEKD